MKEFHYAEKECQQVAIGLKAIRTLLQLEVKQDGSEFIEHLKKFQPEQYFEGHIQAAVTSLCASISHKGLIQKDLSDQVNHIVERMMKIQKQLESANVKIMQAFLVMKKDYKQALQSYQKAKKRHEKIAKELEGIPRSSKNENRVAKLEKQEELAREQYRILHEQTILFHHSFVSETNVHLQSFRHNKKYSVMTLKELLADYAKIQKEALKRYEESMLTISTVMEKVNVISDFDDNAPDCEIPLPEELSEFSPYEMKPPKSVPNRAIFGFFSSESESENPSILDTVRTPNTTPKKPTFHVQKNEVNKEYMDSFTKLLKDLLNGDVSSEQKEEAEKDLKESSEHRLAFAHTLHFHRNHPALPKEAFLYLSKLVGDCMECSYISNDQDVHRLLLNMSQTFYLHASDESPFYIQNQLVHLPMWKDMRFWMGSFYDSLAHERDKQNLPVWKEMTDKEREDAVSAHENVVFGLLGSYAFSMLNVNVPLSEVKAFIIKMKDINNLKEDFETMLDGMIESTYLTIQDRKNRMHGSISNNEQCDRVNSQELIDEDKEELYDKDKEELNDEDNEELNDEDNEELNDKDEERELNTTDVKKNRKKPLKRRKKSQIKPLPLGLI